MSNLKVKKKKVEKGLKKTPNQHSFSDTVGINVRDRNHVQPQNRTDLNTYLLPMLEAMNVFLHWRRRTVV